jgi:uncharacterized ParB-like nuclease family protein
VSKKSVELFYRAMSCDKSIHSAAIDEIHVMPISAIIRPIPSVLDEAKVNSLVATLNVMN